MLLILRCSHVGKNCNKTTYECAEWLGLLRLNEGNVFTFINKIFFCQLKLLNSFFFFRVREDNMEVKKHNI